MTTLKDALTASITLDNLVKTECDPKPIPLRQFDWEAWWANRDLDEDAIIGYGATEAQAIADLIDRSEDR